LISSGDGVFHATLGYALWLGGDRSAAHRVIGIASESQMGVGHPFVMAVRPLLPLAAGDVSAARESLGEAWAALRMAPWPEAVQIASSAEILLLHMAGSDPEKGGYLAQLEERLGGERYDRLVQPVGLTPPPWALHLALAEIWAGDLDAAADRAQALARVPVEPRWAHPAEHWVRGLIAEARGDLTDARDHLATAASGPDQALSGLPLHHAHAYTDLARVERALGRTRPANAAAAAATAGYQKLGATGYLPAHVDSPASGAVLDLLSDRERDVVTLLTQGLSYVQITRELYVTRSTVSFHLSHAYAKTNTTSRHGLVELVRAGA
jgi:DNA-binding CsgD family transcriptional regulator